MNYLQATAHLIERTKGANAKRCVSIAAQVQNTIADCAPRKAFDKDTAKSMSQLNDIGGLVSGDMDCDADMPWLTPEVMRALWNQANRMLGKVV